MVFAYYDLNMVGVMCETHGPRDLSKYNPDGQAGGFYCASSVRAMYFTQRAIHEYILL